MRLLFEGGAEVANGCFAPELVLDFTISNGPLICKLKERSALESLV